jgi:tetratricopeptide (TPR) repeat protein
MFKHKRLSATVALALIGTAVFACGPFFPQQLLDDRAGTLRGTPQNTFAWEAARLLVPSDKLRAVESHGDDNPPQAASDDALSPELRATVEAMSLAANGDEAYAKGAGLPEATRLYRAAVVDYRKNDLAAASKRFDQVLALPGDGGKVYLARAAYMLGQTQALASGHCDDCDRAAASAAAAKAFAQVRTLVQAGAPDAQGLAVASYGEEARLSLRPPGKDATACDWTAAGGTDAPDDTGDAPAAETSTAAPTDGPVSTEACIASLEPAALKRAIGLYAEQAARGSQSGMLSLRYLAAHSFAAPAQVQALIDDPIAQRLLVVYALGYIDDVDTKSPGADYWEGNDAAKGKPGIQPNTVIVVLVDAIAKRGLDHVGSADRLAALAYRAGRYDLALQLVGKTASPLSAWVRAKLALRKGDLAGANAAYADAIKAFPHNDAVEPESAQLIQGEQGVLALARGEYVEAMTHLYDTAQQDAASGGNQDEDNPGVGYADDAAYVAERVLTLDELKQFVDAHVPPPPPPAANKPSDTYSPPLVANEIRQLLARRLMRAGRYDDAQAYFSAGKDKDAGDVDLRAKAHDYAQAMHDAEHAWTALGRARGAWAAAVIARENGMELLGFEQHPDYFDNGGSFDAGNGRAKLEGEFVTAGEHQRFDGSHAQPEFRLHYRYVAADLAVQAADQVPERSQAFAATLCHATGWMMDGPPDYNDEDAEATDKTPAHVSERTKRIDAYYGRYVKHGAHVAWARNWGQDCKDPDFDAAARMVKAQRVAMVKHAIRHYLVVEIGVVVLVVAGFVLLVVRRRRRRKVA